MKALAALALSLAPVPASTQEAPASYAPESFEGVRHPDWSRKAIIYQINTRQFTPQGTFKAATRELPRLKALGAISCG